MTEHDMLIERLLRDSKKVEATKWLRHAPSDRQLTIGECRTTTDSVKLVKKLYSLGAAEVVAVHIKKSPRRGIEHTGKLVVKFPEDVHKRKGIFDWCNQQRGSLGFSPNPDRGETHLFLLLD